MGKEKSAQPSLITEKGIYLLVSLFAALGLTYIWALPPLESPDEPFHLNTARYIAVHHTLPPRTMPAHRMITGADVARSLEYAGDRVFYAPPLYYSLAALIVSWTDMPDLPTLLVPNPNWERGWPPQPDSHPGNKNFYVRLVWGTESETVRALYLLRLFSLGCSVVTVIATHTLTRRLWPDRPLLALGAAVLVALNPQFIALSGGVTNDPLLISLCTIFFGHTVSCLRNGTGARWTSLGVIAGLAMLTKQSGLLLLPIGTVATFIQQALWKRRFRNSGLFLAPALALSLWWYVRGAILYGDPMGFGPHFAGQTPLARFGLREIIAVFQTYWAAFGWGVILVHPPFYWGIAVLLLSAGLALLLALRPGGPWWHLSPVTRRGTALLALAAALNMAALVGWAKSTGAPYGRLLFPTIAPVAVLTAYGLSLWAQRKSVRQALVGIALIAIIFDALIPHLYIRPAFTFSSPLQSLPEGTQPLRAAFQNGPRLIGYRVSRDPLQVGKKVQLTLYWETGNTPPAPYRIWVQLGPQDSTRYVVGEDVWLGSTLYPSHVWRPGAIVRQIHSFSVPEWAPAPGLYWFRLGLVDENGRVPLQDGPGDMIALGPWRLLPDHPVPPPSHPSTFLLGDAVRLKGYDLDWQAGERPPSLVVTLHWQAEQKIERNYIVFVHLVDTVGHLVAQHDGPPRGGAYPTSWWQPGEQIPDPHPISLEGWGGEPLTLQVGIYDPETLERLPAYNREGERFPADAVPLARIWRDEFGALHLLTPEGEE